MYFTAVFETSELRKAGFILNSVLLLQNIHYILYISEPGNTQIWKK